MTPSFEALDVARVVHEARLGPVVSVEHLPVGWGNENWRVRLEAGDLLLLKVAPAAMAAKWSATSLAYAMAMNAGVPVPRLVFVDPVCDRLDGSFVRILTWLDGVDAGSVVEAGGAQLLRFARGLGGALRRLHGVSLPAFTSRLDGSARSFSTWTTFVEHRLGSVLERAGRSGVMLPAELALVERECRALISTVADVPSPVLCHRDLHACNMLVDVDGGFAGLLDFDNAEAWDPAADFVKLRWQILDGFNPEASGAFNDGYLEGGPWPQRWQERLALVDLVELTNNLANARLDGHGHYEHRTRTRLSTVLASRS